MYKSCIYNSYKFKYIFVISSVGGAILVGSVDVNMRIWGFILATVGNVFWIYHHKNVTMDKETMWIFIAYFVINIFAITNNYCGGCLHL